VQGRSLTRQQIEQLHGFAVCVGLLCTIAASATASYVAEFFNEPALVTAIPMMSLSFFFGAFRVVPSAMLSRQMRFRRLAFIDAAEAVCLLVTSIGLALAGYRYWSLVIATVVARALSAALTVRSAALPLSPPTDLRRIAGSLRFGAWVVASSIAWYVYSNADRIVVGRSLGDAALGAYVMGLSLAAVPIEKVAQLYQRVAESVISHVQHDSATVGRYLLGITEGVAMITFPLSVGLMLVAGVFVPVVLGAAWEPSIGPLRILAAAAALRSLDPILGQLLIATGHANVDARSMTLGALVLPFAFWIGAHWGVTGIATVWLVAHPAVVMTRQVWCVLRVSNTRFVDCARALAPAASSTALMALVVLGCQQAISGRLPPAVELACEIGAGVLAYATSLLLLHSRRVAVVWSFIRRGGSAELSSVA
jgi:PST family polysaccharide transporter